MDLQLRIATCNPRLLRSAFCIVGLCICGALLAAIAVVYYHEAADVPPDVQFVGLHSGLKFNMHMRSTGWGPAKRVSREQVIEERKAEDDG